MDAEIIAANVQLVRWVNGRTGAAGKVRLVSRREAKEGGSPHALPPTLRLATRASPANGGEGEEGAKGRGGVTQPLICLTAHAHPTTPNLYSPSNYLQAHMESAWMSSPPFRF